MGWDISYHPFGEDEVRSIYFAALKDPGLVPKLAERFKLEPFYTERLSGAQARADEALALAPNRPWSSGERRAAHGALAYRRRQARSACFTRAVA